MSFQLDPRILLEEAQNQFNNLSDKLAVISPTVAGGIEKFCIGKNCTVTSVRNRFSALIREEVGLKRQVNSLTESIRLLKREIAIRGLTPNPFVDIDLDTGASGALTQTVPIPNNNEDLKKLAIIGGAILLIL